MTDAALELEENQRRSAAQALADRLGAYVWTLKVDAVIDLTPSMRRIRFACLEPDELRAEPGSDLTLAIATRGDATVRRRYTIRHLDPELRTVDLDFVVHGDGPAARWAANARVGTEIEGIGPRGKITVVPDVDWHLFIGDDSYIPASLEMIESLPAAASAYLYLEVEGPADEQPLECSVSLGGPHWVHRGAARPGEATSLIDALRGFSVPPGRGFAYIGGEHMLVNTVRRLLLDAGMAAEDMAPKPYWRLGSANADHGEPPRER